VLIALALLILFGWLRYDNFLGLFNIIEVLRYNSMFALVALGMCFVIMTGGIDLSVGATAALGSVVSAIAQPLWHARRALGGGVAPGSAVGLLNGLVIVRLRILPFIATLARCWRRNGAALLLANQSVSVSYDSGFTDLGQGDFLGFRSPR
jgi:ribose/xylose/arabinose/galactoside ABC-type transport system permease subunit